MKKTDTPKDFGTVSIGIGTLQNLLPKENASMIHNHIPSPAADNQGTILN